MYNDVSLFRKFFHCKRLKVLDYLLQNVMKYHSVGEISQHTGVDYDFVKLYCEDLKRLNVVVSKRSVGIIENPRYAFNYDGKTVAPKPISRKSIAQSLMDIEVALIIDNIENDCDKKPRK